MSHKLARHLSLIKFQLSSKCFSRYFLLFSPNSSPYHQDYLTVCLFILSYSLLHMSRSPFLSCPVLCLCMCVYFSCHVLALWPVWPVFEVWWREDPKERLSLGFFGSLVRALALRSIRPLTFNQWNRMAWKDFCARNPHQSEVSAF